jgi:hypothetical protein
MDLKKQKCPAFAEHSSSSINIQQKSILQFYLAILFPAVSCCHENWTLNRAWQQAMPRGTKARSIKIRNIILQEDILLPGLHNMAAIHSKQAVSDFLNKDHKD